MSTVLPLLLGAVGASMLFVGAKLLVDNASAFAKSFRVPLIAVSFTVIALGTSVPKLIVGIVAGLAGDGELVLGSIVGGAIVNLSLVLGTSALIHPFGFPNRDNRFELLSFVFSAALLYLLAIDGMLGRLDGALLFALGAVFTYVIIASNKAHTHAKAAITLKVAIKRRRARVMEALIMAASIVVIYFGATMVVDNASALARSFHIAEALIALTLVAIGTSLPEIATAIMSSIRRTDALTIGNVIGSNVLNVLSILGLTLIIAPIRVAPRLLGNDLPILAAATIGIALLMRGGRKITRIVGGSLVISYFIYLIFAFNA